jgi:hypothetical protein
MLEGTFRLLDRSALDRKNHVPLRLPADADDPCPVNHTVAAGASDGGAGHLAALAGRLLRGDVLGVQVDQAVEDPFQPWVGIVSISVNLTA